MSQSKHTIEQIKAFEILDSRGLPTVQVELELASGIKTCASVPSGTSTGSHEAQELRDGDLDRYEGLGVRQACSNVDSQIARALKGFEVDRQADIDAEMRQIDGTNNLRKLGANAILGVSLAVARAAALSQDLPLYKYLQELHKGEEGSIKIPVPLFNIFNGGKHADTNLDFQEFMVIPDGVEGNFSEKLRAGAEVFHKLKEVLVENQLDTDVGSEGGYAPNLSDTMQALDLIMEAIDRSGYEPGTQIKLGMDVGASVLFNHDRKVYHFGLIDYDMRASQLISLYHDWLKKYPFIYIEDGLHEDDWDNWRILTKEFGEDVLITGDDLFATNTERLETGIAEKVCNSVIVKPNQIGTLTGTLEFIKLAQANNYKVAISHRSGETNDSFISDLAVGVGADYIKAGSLSRGERLAKYNRLLEIERELVK